MERIKRMKYVSSFMRKQMVHLNLQILYTCNFRCRICDFWKPPFTKMPKLSLDQVRIIADKIKIYGPQIVSIGGGEPLLHPELAGIIQCLAGDHFPVMICNGWYITPENAKALFRAGLYEASVSVDYATAEKHDRQRGVEGAFNRALNALRILQENRTSAHQRVHMISVIMDDNLDEVEAMIRLARDIGVTYLVTLYSGGRGEKESRVSRQDVGHLLSKLRKKYPDFVALPGYLEKFSAAAAGTPGDTNQHMNDDHYPGIFPCYAGKNLFNIDCQGNVTRCIDMLDEPVGNMLTDDAIEIRRKLLEKHLSNRCSRCWTSCRGNIETLMYGKKRLYNIFKMVPLLKKIKLTHPGL